MQALTDLKATGRKVAILSNGSRLMLNSAAQAAGIDVILDKIISVDLVRTYKQRTRAFAPRRGCALRAGRPCRAAPAPAHGQVGITPAS